MASLILFFNGENCLQYSNENGWLLIQCNSNSNKNLKFQLLPKVLLVVFILALSCPRHSFHKHTVMHEQEGTTPGQSSAMILPIQTFSQLGRNTHRGRVQILFMDFGFFIPKSNIQSYNELLLGYIIKA